MSGLSKNLSQSTRDTGRYVGADEPYYTNDDIALLHDIVVAAQDILPSLPERQRLPTHALFQAYYELLSKAGVNADHDNRYARVLFKIGGLRGEGTLIEKFEEILARMGIEIEFSLGDDDESGEQDNRLLEDMAENATETRGTDVDGYQLPAERPRRSSESMAWDYSIQTPARDGRRPRSFSPRSREQPELQLGAAQPANAILSPELRVRPPTSAPFGESDEHRHNVRAWLNSNPVPVRQERSRSASIPASLRIRRRSHSVRGRQRQDIPVITPSIPESDIDPCHVADQDTAITSAEEEPRPDPSIALKSHYFGRASYALMETKARVILQHHLSHKVIRTIRVWRNKAVQSRNENNLLESVAKRHDDQILLGQAFQSWRNLRNRNRHIAEMERFFEHQERKADRARNLYLLSKAFTHWAACTLEQGQLTAAAKRHIVRYRILNAWRDHTVALELQVRRQRLKKFFVVWQGCQVAIARSEDTALVVYQSNLIRNVYSTWFRQHLLVQLILKKERRLKSQMLRVWIEATQEVHNDGNFADFMKQRRINGIFWRTWLRQAQIFLIHNAEAREFYEVGICRKALRKWRREISVVPAKKTVMTEVRRRILRFSFALWLHRTRQEREAAYVDRTRMLQDAVAAWRYEVRCMRYKQIIDTRGAERALMKWRIAAKLHVQEQTHYEKILHRCLVLWVKETRVIRNRRWEQEQDAQNYDTQAIQSQFISALKNRLQASRNRGQQASDIYKTRLLSKVLSEWQGRMPHQRSLKSDCVRAEYYFLARKTLNKWISTTETSRRQKRRTAYRQVRRIIKVNLARSVFSRWRQKAGQIADMQSQATEVSRNKTIIFGMNVFDHWKARTEELCEQEAICNERILRKHLYFWRERSSAYHILNSEAMFIFQENQQSRAVKKWTLRLLQIHSQALYAAEVRERNVKRGFRKIFGYWQTRTGQRRPVVRADSRVDGQQPHMGTPARAEVWSDFEDDLEVDELTRRMRESRGITNRRNDDQKLEGASIDQPQTPIPGYMATPSRRMERVSAAAAKFGSTTPRLPLDTPTERLLRARWNGKGDTPMMDRLLLSRRPSTLGRSTLGGEFRDVPRQVSGSPQGGGNV